MLFCDIKDIPSGVRNIDIYYTFTYLHYRLFHLAPMKLEVSFYERIQVLQWPQEALFAIIDFIFSICKLLFLLAA